MVADRALGHGDSRLAANHFAELDSEQSIGGWRSLLAASMTFEVRNRDGNVIQRG